MRTYQLTRAVEPQTDTVFYQYGPDHAWLVQGTSLGRAWVFVSAALLFNRLDKAVATVKWNIDCGRDRILIQI
jgi:hypothetical protein